MDCASSSNHTYFSQFWSSFWCWNFEQKFLEAVPMVAVFSFCLKALDVSKLEQDGYFWL